MKHDLVHRRPGGVDVSPAEVDAKRDMKDASRVSRPFGCLEPRAARPTPGLVPGGVRREVVVVVVGVEESRLAPLPHLAQACNLQRGLSCTTQRRSQERRQDRDDRDDYQQLK